MGININGQDFDGSFEDIIEAAKEFGNRIKEMAPELGPMFDSCRRPGHEAGRASSFYGADARAAQASEQYPPFNTYTSRDGAMVMEFALAGIDEGDVSITFQGDYLVLSAKAPVRDDAGDGFGFSARGFKPRNIDRQRYMVKASDFEQEKAKAVFKNGVLTVTVPPAEIQGIKIEIVKEGN